MLRFDGVLFGLEVEINGCDGIIYADMEPKEQFWRVKKAYSAEGR